MANILKIKKIRIAIIGIIVALIVFLAFALWFFNISEYANFQDAKDEALSIAGHLGTDGKVINKYFKIDTKISEIPLEEMTSLQKNLYLTHMRKAIEAIKSTNLKLGFGGSLYDYMAKTNTAMGAQTEENDKYIVTWTYSPDDGLEVKYQIKFTEIF